MGLLCLQLKDKDVSPSSVIMGLAALSYFWAPPQTSYKTFRKQLRIDPFLLPSEMGAVHGHDAVLQTPNVSFLSQEIPLLVCLLLNHSKRGI